MGNMLDYLRWRGDLTLDVVPLCEVDGLILSQLASLRWETWLNPREVSALSTLTGRIDGEEPSACFTGKNDLKLLALAAESARFGGVRVLDHTHAFDAETGIQFAAVALALPDDTLFIAFRGTDSTLVGWKENFDMAYASPVPAQAVAHAYLTRVAELYRAPIRVGGHSKGGNLAMYAAATAEPSVRGRLLDVFSFDGPGLSDSLDATALYARLGSRLRAFVPQSSVIGMLLAHPENFEVVKSDAVSILQHDPYTWQVEGGRFLRAPGLSRDSVFVESLLRDWLSQMDARRRGAVVEVLFALLGSVDARRFDHRLLLRMLTNPGAVIAAAQGLDPEKRREARGAIGELALRAVLPRNPS